MSSTEYRVVRHYPEDGKMLHTIHQVVYDKAGNPISLSVPIEASSENAEGLMHTLIHMLGALTKPIIDSKVFTPLTDSKSVDTAFDLLQPKNKNV